MINPTHGAGKAVVLLSGGLDSTTVLYYAKSRGYDCACLIFDYGQRHNKEVGIAKKIAGACGVPYHLIKFRMPWKGSALLDKKIAVPKGKTGAHAKGGIPVTYIPARNTVFLSFAVSFAEAIGASAIFIGANAVDFSGYPDCRPGYYKVFNSLIKRGTRAGAVKKKISVLTPLIHKTKAEIIRLGKRLGVPYGYTWSCYMGNKHPCMKCDSCVIRAKGFKEAKVTDPLTAI
jgi:7-cyano-7-deazaguanine synthase